MTDLPVPIRTIICNNGGTPPVLFGSYYMTANQVWLWTHPQPHCYVYAQIYVRDE